MEESELIPEGTKENESLSENNENSLKQDKLTDLTEDSSLDEVKPNISNLQDNNFENQSNIKKESIFNRFLKEGFDGITSNPNYKLLALLIILLINLSLFLLVGNLGKSFLQNSGLLS